LAKRRPEATVWAVDVNERALDLTRENASANGVADRVRVCLPEDVPADVAFAGIWSNPPIRVGKEALHALLTLWLPRLSRVDEGRVEDQRADEGQAWLVVSKNLGADSLASWLGEQGWDVERLRSRMGYRILQVSYA
jgi:16S rRNA G1207 methylase RsmC